jgi:hypothetical protein
MNKKEIYTLMVLIQVYYERFHFDQQKLDAWHMVLQKYSYDKVHENLRICGRFTASTKN